jgi:hypothetical protein
MSRLEIVAVCGEFLVLPDLVLEDVQHVDHKTILASADALREYIRENY